MIFFFVWNGHFLPFFTSVKPITATADVSRMSIFVLMACLKI